MGGRDGREGGREGRREGWEGGRVGQNSMGNEIRDKISVVVYIFGIHGR